MPDAAPVAGAKRRKAPPRRYRPETKPRAKGVEQRIRFAQEFVKDFNARKAAIRAGYSPRSASTAASKLLKMPVVQAELAKMRELVREDALVTAREVIEEIRHSAFLDPGDLFDDKGNLKNVTDMPPAARRALSSFETTEEKIKGTEDEWQVVRKIKLNSKLHGLELLGKYLKLWGLDGSHQAVARVRFVDLTGNPVEVEVGVRSAG